MTDYPKPCQMSNVINRNPDFVCSGPTPQIKENPRNPDQNQPFENEINMYDNRTSQWVAQNHGPMFSTEDHRPQLISASHPQQPKYLEGNICTQNYCQQEIKVLPNIEQNGNISYIAKSNTNISIGNNDQVYHDNDERNGTIAAGLTSNVSSDQLQEIIADQQREILENEYKLSVQRNQILQENQNDRSNQNHGRFQEDDSQQQKQMVQNSVFHQSCHELLQIDSQQRETIENSGLSLNHDELLQRNGQQTEQYEARQNVLMNNAQTLQRREVENSNFDSPKNRSGYVRKVSVSNDSGIYTHSRSSVEPVNYNQSSNQKRIYSCKCNNPHCNNENITAKEQQIVSNQTSAPRPQNYASLSDQSFDSTSNFSSVSTSNRNIQDRLSFQSPESFRHLPMHRNMSSLYLQIRPQDICGPAMQGRYLEKSNQS